MVFIENSDYQNFAALQGPPKDASLITGVLEDDYQVLPVKRIRNQTKQEMEKFFSIDLRDEVRANRSSHWSSGSPDTASSSMTWATGSRLTPVATRSLPTSASIP